MRLVPLTSQLVRLVLSQACLLLRFLKRTSQRAVFATHRLQDSVPIRHKLIEVAECRLQKGTLVPCLTQLHLQVVALPFGIFQFLKPQDESPALFFESIHLSFSDAVDCLGVQKLSPSLTT